MKNSKKVFRWFLADDYEEEEKWLQEMHRRGWALLKTHWSFYTFQRCEPLDMEYRLDFGERYSGANIMTLYQGQGWEYVLDSKLFSYFRRQAGGYDAGIFMTDQERLKLAKKVAGYRIIPTALLLVISIPLILKGMNEGSISGSSGFFFCLIWAAVMIIGIVEIARQVLGFRKLTDKYGQDEA